MQRRLEIFDDGQWARHELYSMTELKNRTAVWFRLANGEVARNHNVTTFRPADHDFKESKNDPQPVEHNRRRVIRSISRP